MGDHVLEHELALFQALELKLIHQGVFRQANNHLIQITMLDAQFAELTLVIFDFSHLHGRTLRRINTNLHSTASRDQAGTQRTVKNRGHRQGV